MTFSFREKQAFSFPHYAHIAFFTIWEQIFSDLSENVVAHVWQRCKFGWNVKQKGLTCLKKILSEEKRRKQNRVDKKMAEMKVGRKVLENRLFNILLWCDLLVFLWKVNFSFLSNVHKILHRSNVLRNSVVGVSLINFWKAQRSYNVLVNKSYKLFLKLVILSIIMLFSLNSA